MANQYDTNLKLQAIADAIGDSQSSGLISALEDIADAVAGGGGGSSAGLVSDNFSETDTYDLGDYCIHNNTLYVCINAINTPGPWDLSDWQATNAGMELSSLNSALDVSDFTFTAGANCTIVVQDSFVFNKIVHLNVMLTVSTALANGAVMLALPTGYTLKRRCDYQLHTGQNIAGAINGNTINANVGGSNTLTAGTYILTFDITLN